MSGHSKWNNIKRKKEATDAAKAKIFTKIGREITVCVKEGGADPSSNAKLRDLIAKAKSNNVPNDNIDRVIKKAAGGGDKNNYESIVYEGYGPNGVAVIVECLTDNGRLATFAITSTNSAVTSVQAAVFRFCSPKRAWSFSKTPVWMKIPLWKTASHLMQTTSLSKTMW